MVAVGFNPRFGTGPAPNAVDRRLGWILAGQLEEGQPAFYNYSALN